MADAVFRAANELEKLPEMMNVCVGADHSINDYYRIVANVIGWGGTFTHDLSKPVGMARKLSDISRQTAWGWQSKTSIEEGIAKTYQHYLETIEP